MSDLSTDTNKLFLDFLNILERTLVIVWNLLMKILIAVKVMPIFRKYPKLFLALILILSVVTPPIAVLWIAMGFVALNEEVKSDNDFLILPKEQVVEDEENEIEVVRDELAMRLYEQGIDKPIEVANTFCEKQYGKPIDQLIDVDKYKQ